MPPHDQQWSEFATPRRSPGLLFEPEFGSVQVKSRLIAPGIGALIGLERKRRPRHGPV